MSSQKHDEITWTHDQEKNLMLAHYKSLLVYGISPREFTRRFTAGEHVIIIKNCSHLLKCDCPLTTTKVETTKEMVNEALSDLKTKFLFAEGLHENKQR